MAITRRTLNLLQGLRVTVDRSVSVAEQSLISAWGTAWNEVSAEWAAAAADLVADGKTPTKAAVLRASRAQRALKITREALADLTKLLPVTVTQAATSLATDTTAAQALIIASQYPSQAGTQAALAAGFDRVDAAALKAIVERSTTQVTALSRPLTAQAEAAMRSALIRGIAAGDNPRVAAASMVQRVHSAFDGGLTRSLVIARTEMLDAHRAAGHASNVANEDVLTGWTWVASLDARTCPSCWAKHGTVYGVNDRGPEDHQQGRCTGAPLTKSWADLGFPGLDEPDSLLPDAQAVFAGLSKADQLAVMGPARLQLLQSGDVAWADLTTKRTTSGWRDSWAPTPVSALTKSPKSSALAS